MAPSRSLPYFRGMEEPLTPTDEQLCLLAAVDNELKEITASVDRRIITVEVANERMARWKARAVREIGRIISPVEAKKIAGISLQPRWVQQETLLDVIGRHHAFLVALYDEIATNPAAFPPPALLPTPKKPKLTPPRAPARPLSAPPQVTLAWLWHHVPAKLWITAIVTVGGALTFALGLGVRLAQEPAFLRVVGPVLGIDAAPRNEQAPSAPGAGRTAR